MCFPDVDSPVEPPKPPPAPEAVSKAPVSGVAIQKQEKKKLGLPATSLLIPRSTVNIPGA